MMVCHACNQGPTAEADNLALTAEVTRLRAALECVAANDMCHGGCARDARRALAVCSTSAKNET